MQASAAMTGAFFPSNNSKKKIRAITRQLIHILNTEYKNKALKD